ncbi:MAG: NUDIX hydrolase [Proteobacteria bacterium]|nr:NUDIX hydrolase [Pseudomonadota bacterium]
MTLKPWKILSSKYLVQDRWINLRADRCETAEGAIIEPFYIFEKADWTHVVPFDDEQRILIVRQYRHGAREVCAEIPCGLIDDSDASPLDAVKRELLEETGCEAKRIESLGSVYANPARQTNKVHSFIAFGTRQVAEQHLDETEDIEFEFVEINKLMQLIDRGEFSQSLHISSIFLALRYCGLLDKAYHGTKHGI